MLCSPSKAFSTWNVTLLVCPLCSFVALFEALVGGASFFHEVRGKEFAYGAQLWIMPNVFYTDKCAIRAPSLAGGAIDKTA